MFTTAGCTRFTSGAKLWPGCIVAAGGAAGTGSLAAGGSCAHTSGDSAKLAPRPKPSAAARVFFNEARRRGAAGKSVIDNLLLRAVIADNMPQIGRASCRERV